MLYAIFKKEPPVHLEVGQSRIEDEFVHFFDMREYTPTEIEAAKAAGYRFAWLFVECWGRYGDTYYGYIGYEIL